MGSWTVRLNWSVFGNSLHDPDFGDGLHDAEPSCRGFTCLPVVEEHQPGPEIPEFTISVRWQEGILEEYLEGKSSRAHGWRYVMSWYDGGGKRVVSGYGFHSEQAARDEAEMKATKIVKAQQPEKVYKFTPEV